MVSVALIVTVSAAAAEAAAALLAPTAASTSVSTAIRSTTTPSWILLPQSSGRESPACLDGSPYGFQFVPSATPSTKWTVSMRFGGWCRDETECFFRTQLRAMWGSSKNIQSMDQECKCMNTNEDGSEADCNCIFMPYCDGASFSGFRAEPWPVPNKTGKVLYFRGLKNLDGTLDWALAHGLDKATEFVLTGSSAGGLAALLHIDRVADRLAREAPGCKLVRAVADSGFFLDQQGHARHVSAISNLVRMHNVTAGLGFPAACGVAYPNKPFLCFFTPRVQKFIQTPFFLLQSKFDTWSLTHLLSERLPGEAWQAEARRFGGTFLARFQSTPLPAGSGAAITSCMCHIGTLGEIPAQGRCAWDKLMVDGSTTWTHYSDWYHGRTSGPGAIHIDMSETPNSNDTQEGMCSEMEDLESADKRIASAPLV